MVGTRRWIIVLVAAAWAIAAGVGLFARAGAAGAADASPPAAKEEADNPLPVPEAIRAEAVRAGDDPVGRPLPLASHWNTGRQPPDDTFDPAWQLELIDKGHHVLPFLHMPDPGLPGDHKSLDEYYEAAIKRAAALKLPLSLIATQWESLLTYDKAYLDLPADKNPNVVAADGKVRREVDPFGPVEPWRDVGTRWTAGPAMKCLQEWYPDPPLVVLVSNNEHAKLRWAKAEESKRYLDRYGTGKDGEFKRRVVAEGWIERYRALMAGMRDGLANPTWKKNAVFVGYEAFGPPHFARWGGWKEYSLAVAGRIDPSPLAWDGGSPSFYVHNWNASTDYTVWSPQIEAMNWVFMQQEARALNPRFWFEISTWDGNVNQPSDKRKLYAARGQAYGPERYAGMVQFGLWLLRPRVVREFRGWTEKRSVQGPYFLAIVEAVDRVHTRPVLRRFWRKGELVANRRHPHPYQVDVPPEYRPADRWFLLDTDLDPQRPWEADTELPVFALALATGRGPERQWLVYAQAPLGPRTSVRVTVPDFGPVKIDAPPAGAFYLVDERTKNVAAVR
jgi:hypothetical protein